MKYLVPFIKDDFLSNIAGIRNQALFQGVRWDASADTYTRTGSISNIPVGQSAGNANLPIHRLMRRCMVLDDRSINYFISDIDPTQKEGGGAADYSGGDGQVMTYIKKFYYRRIYDGNTRGWDVSLYPLPGFSVFPAFVSNGVEYSHILYGSFEGAMLDATTGLLIPKANVTDNMYATGDKLCSVIADDGYPKTSESRPEFRTMAAERGTGWLQESFWFRSAVQMLYAIEYADFNSQAMIGTGRSILPNDVWVADSNLGKCGMSLNDGNTTNAVQNGGTEGQLTDYMTYRGIENIYGNPFTFLDGIVWDGRWTGVVAAQPVYVSNNPADFKDEQQGNMDFLVNASYIGSNDGYISDVEDVNGFIPLTANGSSSTKISDYYWQYCTSAHNYWRTVMVGGHSYTGAFNGVYALYVVLNRWADHEDICSRLCAFGKE